LTFAAFSAEEKLAAAFFQEAASGSWQAADVEAKAWPVF